jgi:tetratricopeptide (TPR) repeat protein
MEESDRKNGKPQEDGRATATPRTAPDAPEGETIMDAPVSGTPPASSKPELNSDETFLDGPRTPPVLRSRAERTVSSGYAVSGILNPGDVVGERYEILQILGEGGMGSVYKARDRELERLVALKVVRAELARNPEIVRRFKQELILARQVTHKNVIRIHDLGQAEGLQFITMDFVEGRDLRALLRDKGKLAPEEAAKIMLQICRALEAAHSEGVIHRDLKPQNVMLDASGRVYVMDFGIARSAHLPGMTQTGALIGTPEYMSPEQARGEKLTERSDIFSLGVIFYELLMGGSPYASDTPLATLWKRMQEKAVPPAVTDPTIPKALSDIVVKALEIEPEDRFASAGEMAAQLELWLGPGAGGITTIIVQQAQRDALPWKWLSVAVIVLLALGSGITYWLKDSGKPKAPHAPVGILVADFTNHTGDPIFDGTLEPMFNVALEGASFINAYNRGSARKLAQKLPHPTDKLDEQPARLVAVSQGIGAVIIGELSRRGEKYSLSATALDAVSGNVIAKSETTADNKDGVLLVIPKLVAPIRRALGDVTPESVQLAAEAGAFQAASLEAVHQYGVAMEQQFAGQMSDALASFSKAAELDPNFARAYAGMAAVAGNLGRDQDAEKYIKTAMEHVDRMTERERYRIRGLYYIRTENWEKCVEEYTELVKQFPSDNLGQDNLAYCLASLHNMPRAMQEAQRAVQMAPKDVVGRMNLALYSCYAGDFQTCEREGLEVQKLSPLYEEAYLVRAYAQLGQGQLAKAAEIYQDLQKLGTRGASLAAAGLANIALYEGNYRKAAQILEKAAAADQAAKEPDRAADSLSMLSYAQILSGDKPAAIASAEKALVNSQSPKTEFLAARIYLQAGQTAKALQIASALTSDLRAEPRAYGKLIEGEAALSARDPKHAIQLIDEAKNLADLWLTHFDLGIAYLDAGAFPEADSELDRCVKRRGEILELFQDDMPTYSYLPPVYYFQGRVREGLKSTGYDDSYRTYLSIREKAGEDPLLADARKRVGN